MEAQVQPQPTKIAPGIIVLGSTSAIVRAAAIELAKQGYDVVLGARDREENEFIAKDMSVRSGVNVWPLTFEADDFDSHAAFFQQCRDLLHDSIAGILIGFGMDAQEAQTNFAVAEKMINTNFTACVSILEITAQYFEQNKDTRPKTNRPFIAVISSVAGDRGKQSNYIYGASKAGLSTYLQGLRNRLFSSRVIVLTIKPGFVDTKMTFARNLKMPAAPPESVGPVIARAIRKKKSILYVPWKWRYIMLIIRHVPEFMFKRLHM